MIQNISKLFFLGALTVGYASMSWLGTSNWSEACTTWTDCGTDNGYNACDNQNLDKHPLPPPPQTARNFDDIIKMCGYTFCSASTGFDPEPGKGRVCQCAGYKSFPYQGDQIDKPAWITPYPPDGPPNAHTPLTPRDTVECKWMRKPQQSLIKEAPKSQKSK